MRAGHSLSIILLALLSRVSAEEPVRVIATIPNESLLSANPGLIESKDGDTRPMKDVEVTGFITKNGDIFEISDSTSMGSVVSRQLESIESRQEPELEPGMSMCRYGNIVVYSDSDCKTFFKPTQNLDVHVKNENEEPQSAAEEETEEKPPKKKKKTRGNRRNSNKKKVQKRKKNKKNIKRKNQLRRKPQSYNNRRRSTLNKNQKRRKNQQKRNKQRNKKRNRNRINYSEERSATLEPMQFAVLYDRF